MSVYLLQVTMQTAYIIHGWDGSPKEPMLQWLKTALVKRGYAVVVPEMPNPAEPQIVPWVETLQERVRSGEETVLIAHSIGCQAALRYLEGMPQGSGIADLVLIAPWMALDETYVASMSEGERAVARPWMETPINFAKVKPRARHITAIFSDNDPYVPLSQKDLFQKELGATIVVERGNGHFDPSSGVKELPSALDAAVVWEGDPREERR
jgi:uncharacterized protein